MRRLVLVLLVLLVVPDSAQSQQHASYRWALAPQIALGQLGRRWEGNLQGYTTKLGPMRKPQLGMALELRPGGRLAYELAAAFIATDYAADVRLSEEGDPDRIRGAGSLHIYRTSAGVLYRIRPEVPGYFALGGGMLYHSPQENVQYWRDEAQWGATAHVGLGFDVGSQGHFLRIDGRVHFVKMSEEVDSDLVPLEPVLARDWLLSLGYLFRL